MKVATLLLVAFAIGCESKHYARQDTPSDVKARIENPAIKPETADPAVQNTDLPEAHSEPASPGGDKPIRPVNDLRVYQLGDLETTEVRIGNNRLTVWVMDNNSKRAEGMMHLTDKEVKPNEGMLFVFPSEEPRGFWMKNTLIPLDIAYIAKNGTIVSVHTMNARDETSVPSKGPAMFALEMKAGAFKRLKIAAGMTCVIAPEIRAFE